jgi:hypothetical protein
VNKGHYVVYIQPANSRNWALFDDQTVRWAQEEEVLHQGTALLIYSRQSPPTLFGENKANQQIMDRPDSPNLMTSHQQQGRDIAVSVPPGKDEEQPTHPENPKLARVGSEQSQTKNIIADQAGRQRGLQRFQDALKKKTDKIINRMDLLSTITQWLSGQNR